MRYALLIVMLGLCAASVVADEDYFPMAVGQHRTMTRTSVTPDTTSDQTISQSIADTVERDGRTYFRCTSGHSGLQLHLFSPALMRKDERAVYRRYEGYGDPFEKIEYALPLRVGATWKRGVGEDVLDVNVMGIETVELSGRSYENCFHIRMTKADGSYTSDCWLAPTVGVVKEEEIFPRTRVRVTSILKEFRPGK